MYKRSHVLSAKERPVKVDRMKLDDKRDRERDRKRKREKERERWENRQHRGEVVSGKVVSVDERLKGNRR